MSSHVEDTCEIICESNGRKVVAEVLDFQEKKFLSVSIDRNFKLELRWNGHEYEGKNAALTFLTDGPIITNTRTSKRG